MGYLNEKVAYLKGLAEGMQISDSTNEGKLLKAIIDVLDDMAVSVSEIEEIQDQLGEQVDNIDEDLAQIEKIIFDDDEEGDDEGIGEFECPYCSEIVTLDENSVDEDDEIECPHCHEKIKVNWECGCEECCDKEDE